MESAELQRRSPASAAAEYERRLGAVRALMAAEGFDVLVAVDDDRWELPGGHVRYLSNFHSGQWAPCAMVVPADGEPTLVVAPGPRGALVEWARQTAWPARIQSSSTSGWPPRHDLWADVVAAIEAGGHATERIGVCGEGAALDALAAALPGEVAAATIADGRGIPRDIVQRVRDLKGEGEIALLAEGQDYVDAGVRTFFEAVEPGRKLTRAIAEGEWTAMSLGADDTLTIMAAGSEPWMWWVTQGERGFSKGDLVSMEINARVKGYVAQIARSATIGPPSAAQRLILETARASLQAMVDRLAPGVTGGELWDAALEVVNDAGLGTYGRFGHGIGLSMAEGFDVLAGDDNPVRVGQCVELHAGVMDAKTNQSALIGDQFAIKEEGAVPLSKSLVPHDLPVGS